MPSALLTLESTLELTTQHNPKPKPKPKLDAVKMPRG
jgi:hypothetical protein